MISKILGFLVLTGSLAVVYLYETSSLASGAFRIFHWPAMVLTGIGPLGLVLLCSDWDVIRRSLKLLAGPAPAQRLRQHEEEGSCLQRLGNDFYQQGAKVLDGLPTKRFSPFFRKTIERLAMRMPTSDVRDLLERERDRGENRLLQSVSLFGLGVRLAPSIGMLGTILGMVHLLSSLSDPSHIGSHMGLALLTTFYGLFFSLAVWTPLQQRLERYLDIELDGYDQILHWLELLEKRKPAQYFSDLLEGSRETSHAQAPLV